MKRKRIFLVIIAVLFVLTVTATLLWLIFRPRLSDEEQIVMVIDKIEVGIENKQSSLVMSQISREYRDSEGLNYTRLRYLASRILRGHERATVDIVDFRGPIIQGNQADLSLRVNIAALDGDTVLAKINGDIDLVLRKDKKGWKIVRADGWQQWVVGVEPLYE